MLRKLNLFILTILLGSVAFAQDRTTIGPSGISHYGDDSPNPRDVLLGDTLGLGIFRMAPDTVIIPNDTGISTSVELEDEYGVVICKRLDSICDTCEFETLAFVRKCSGPVFTSIATKVDFISVGNVNIGSPTNDFINVYAQNYIETTLLRSADTDVEELNYGLETVMKMRPVKNRSGSSSSGRSAGSGEIGFLPRELQTVVPELVAVSENGETAGVRLNALFPILVSSIQELAIEQEEIIASQSEQIAALQSQLDAISQQLEQLSAGSSQNNFSYLAQNIPNPFNQRSTIAYFLAKDAANARILFYRTDSGALVKEIDLNPTAGKGTAEVSTAGFQTGSYVYSLEIDGRVLDSKIMIVQE